MDKKIAIQGIKGSFHHQVAVEYYKKEVTVDECLSFEEVIKSLITNQSEEAIMAIENSIVGSIIPNYALIDKHNLQIIGEYYIPIEQNLMALSGQTLADIKEVHSHPMALLQCMDFLQKYPKIKLIEDKDTAETARRIANQNLYGIAAIGSKTAAILYKLNIIAPSIQTIANNMTRFVIVSKEKQIAQKKAINKASLKFQLNHKRGSLATVLNIMSDCKLNLTKIQSIPVIETPFKYSFFVDVTFDDYSEYEKAISIVNSMANEFKILGEYKNNNYDNYGK